MTRGAWEALQPQLPETPQEQLDAHIGHGVYSVMEHETLGDIAACQRCSRFSRKLIKLSNRNWLANAETHNSTHPDVRGMHTLEADRPARGPAAVATDGGPTRGGEAAPW